MVARNRAADVRATIQRSRRSSAIFPRVPAISRLRPPLLMRRRLVGSNSTETPERNSQARERFHAQRTVLRSHLPVFDRRFSVSQYRKRRISTRPSARKFGSLEPHRCRYTFPSFDKIYWRVAIKLLGIAPLISIGRSLSLFRFP